jgi:hypothetical protein
MKDQLIITYIAGIAVALIGISVKKNDTGKTNWYIKTPLVLLSFVGLLAVAIASYFNVKQK